jgi:hypothetical protein
VALFEKNDRIGGLLRYGIPTSNGEAPDRSAHGTNASKALNSGQSACRAE